MVSFIRPTKKAQLWFWDSIICHLMISVSSESFSAKCLIWYFKSSPHSCWVNRQTSFKCISDKFVSSAQLKFECNLLDAKTNNAKNPKTLRIIHKPNKNEFGQHDENDLETLQFVVLCLALFLDFSVYFRKKIIFLYNTKMITGLYLF